MINYWKLQVALNMAKKVMDLVKSASERPVAELAFEVQEARPHNALRQVQRHRFQPKRRKVVRIKTTQAKPTADDVNEIKNAWGHAVVQFCSKCLLDEDTLGRGTIDWMFCEECKAWLHLACCLANDENLLCPHCKGVVTDDEDED